MKKKEVKEQLRERYAWLSKKYRTKSERRPVEQEIRELKKHL